MTPPARLLTLMGSGELSPTMVKVHREVLERMGPPRRALLLDTPFAFQENARELAGRAAAYFSESLQTVLEVPPGEGDDDGGRAAERLTTSLRAARYVFSGPGSPTYALRVWRKGVVPELLREKLASGGAVTFASAAALTLGAFTVPVYEIYKVGEEPHWVEGLDLLSSAGLNVALVPHFNNAEGGTHDTRFCYLGERRLATMERQLPEETFVLGVDEHTSLHIDLETGIARVGGLGSVTVRKDGRATVYPTGATVTVAELNEAARRGGAAPPGAPDALPTEPGGLTTDGEPPLLSIVHRAEAAFDAALEAGRADEAASVALGLEEELHAWSTDIPGADELDRARASLRAMVDRLGLVAAKGALHPREVLGPYIDLLVSERESLRAAHRFDDADELRKALASLGVELRDVPEGTEWHLKGVD